MIAETDKLILRELTTLDAKHFFKLNSDPEVMLFTGDDPFQSVTEAEHFLEHYSHYSEHGFGRWAVIRKSDNEFIGWCGLKMHQPTLRIKTNNYVDIGFRFFRKYWGQRYATEAARKSLELGFSRFGLKEIIGRTAKENIGSIKVLEKIGLSYFKNGECEGIEDALYYRIAKSLR